jgi:mRNA interferase RelE/StbE
MQRLPKDLLQRIWSAIRVLAQAPRPVGCKKLVGYDNLYRVRVGEWRISYAIEDDRLIVLILEVAPRGGAYRNF